MLDKSYYFAMITFVIITGLQLFFKTTSLITMLKFSSYPLYLKKLFEIIFNQPLHMIERNRARDRVRERYLYIHINIWVLHI